MKIVCPQCQTAYELAPTALGSNGRSVRCARCRTVWFAEAPDLLSDLGVETVAGPHPAFATVPTDHPPANSDVGDIGSPALAPRAETEAQRTAMDTAAPAAPPAMTAGDSAVADAAVEALALQTPAVEIQEPATPEADPIPAPELTTADIETIAARRAKSRRPLRKPGKSAWQISPVAALIAALIAIDTGLVIWRADVVRMLPQTAPLFEHIGLPVNLRGLTFTNLRTSYEDQDGVGILVIEGNIVATSRKIVDVPRLRFAIESGNGHEIYAWTALPNRTRLAPGESLPFRSRLASPPEQGRSMNVRFFNRQDLASGLP